VLLAALALGGPLGAQGAPGDPPPSGCSLREAPAAPSPDLYCIDLVPVPDLRDASGTVELGHVPSPFGTAVSVDGVHRYRLRVRAAGLPDPATLGPYTTYVAWATTPLLRPVVRLGALDALGEAAGEVAFNKFLVLITAEAAADGDDWGGKVVLRGLSASNRLLPADDPVILMGAASPPDEAHDHHHGHPEEGGALRWTPPPMDPSRFMPPGMMSLRPDADPYLPSGTGLPDARPREVVELRDGDTFELTAGLVRRTIEGRTLTMYGFNGQYPGPLIRVREDARVTVRFHNRLDLPTAVHWHGIRLDNRFDGVPFVTQEPVAPGDSFRYEIHFRDPGIYWYHPHHREDVQQDLGLYGNILVSAPRPDFYSPVNREEVLMLDDLLLAEAGLVPFGRETPTHALMGRFGNLMLVNGEPDYRLAVRRGEVVRFFLTNASNTRTFNLSFGGAPMKVVGSDVGRFEREEWIESVVVAPAERYIVEVRFTGPGEHALTNRVQALDHVAGSFLPQVDTLGIVRVEQTPAERDFSAAFERLRENREVVAELDRYRPFLDRAPDHTLVLTMEASGLPFPVHAMMRHDSAYFHPVEWSSTMEEMNWVTTGKEVEWILHDPATGKRNMDVRWRFRVGEVARIRLVNAREALHAMHHPIHIHGQRFLVLSQNGVPNPNLVWKDTMLLPVGQTAEILLELSNPGDWMLHCHIAEHMETGMHMVFTVDPVEGTWESPHLQAHPHRRH
jgi:suppressor of ftsI